MRLRSLRFRRKQEHGRGPALAAACFAAALAASGPVALRVATRKSAWIVRADTARSRWSLEGPHFLGHVVHHLVLDPRGPPVRPRSPLPGLRSA